jgi:crotonobetainyl-CoA:carnitine CoA-transferase CaiB-like acyl-CoA transferase
MAVQPLEGIKVIDIATLFAGPVAAMFLGDYGADVIKVEHPTADPVRVHGPTKDNKSLWWTMFGRNKRTVTCKLSTPEGAAILKKLAATADVIVENFRPGTLERWGLGYEELSKENPGLVLVRVTGFGQFGPYAKRPGFGTLAEAMSGFAAITGQADGPPTLPPFGLADGITGLAAAYATMIALHSRARTGKGQVVDIALIEPIVTILGAQPIVYDQLGEVPTRTGNRSKGNAPRNTYLTRDGKWLAISTSSTSIAERLLRLTGGEQYVSEPWFQTARGRLEHVEELDACVASWIAARDSVTAIAEIEKAEAAVGPIYDIADIFADPQYQALDTITTVEDPVFGPVRMQNVLFRLSEEPGAIRFTGRPLGADNDEIYRGELGMSSGDLAGLKAKGII